MNNTKITDAGLIHLSKLTALKVLYLDKTQITNVGLTHLSKLNALFELYLFNTPITNAGYEKIKAALPKMPNWLVTDGELQPMSIVLKERGSIYKR